LGPPGSIIEFRGDENECALLGGNRPGAAGKKPAEDPLLDARHIRYVAVVKADAYGHGLRRRPRV
jgi:hypothetical protein